MTGFNSKREAAADKLWDKPSVAFDEWWNDDNDESTNPFRLESGAYWAWAGWKAALAQPPLPVQPSEEWPGQSNIESPHNACQHRGYCKQMAKLRERNS